MQGTAADITKKALAMLPEALEETESRIIGCIHDEILLETLEANAEQAAKILKVVEKSGHPDFPPVRSPFKERDGRSLKVLLAASSRPR